jgi:hypothetical protein
VRVVLLIDLQPLLLLLVVVAGRPQVLHRCPLLHLTPRVLLL